MATDPTIPSLVKYDVKNGVVRRRWLSTWYDAQGKRHSKQFGWESDTTEKRAIARWERFKLKHKTRVKLRTDKTRFTVTRLAAKYLNYARRTYVKHGVRTSHVPNVVQAMRAIRDAWGTRTASDVEAPDMALLRDAMVHRVAHGGERTTRAIKTVNGRLVIIVQAFDHAREYGLVTREVVADLRSVKRLRRGRTDAKPPKKVKSAPAADVAAVYAVLPKVVRALVDTLTITGMRPNEACIMRGCDLVTNRPESEGLWEYRPAKHKMEHVGEYEEDTVKVVFLGKRAQDIIAPFLKSDLSAYLFSPAEAQAERLAIKRQNRKTKLYPSHAKKRVADPTARLGDHYTSETLRRTVHYACRKTGLPLWNPGQLRHATATEREKQYGRGGSRVVLGHTSETTTSIYIDPDVQLAMRIAREVG